MILRRRAPAVRVQRWTPGGRFVGARLDRAVGPLKGNASATLWSPDSADILLDGPAPTGTPADDSVTDAAVLGLPVREGSTRCGAAVKARTVQENARWVVQLADRWLRACDRRTGRRRYAETYSPSDAYQDVGDVRTVGFSSFDLAGDTLAERRTYAQSHYGDSLSIYTTVDLVTGRRARAGARSAPRTYPSTGDAYARLAAVGTCVAGVRSWIPAPSTDTLVLADGFTVHQNVYGTSVPADRFGNTTVAVRTSISYVDKTGAHVVPVRRQDPRDQSPGVVRVTPTTIIVQTDAGPQTITPVPFGTPEPTAAGSC